MPIMVKDYTWRQSETKVFICVPLNGVHSRKVDIFTSDSFLKMCYPPFLFEVYLKGKINEKDSKCTFTDTEALFELQKQEESQWESLEGNYSKEEKFKLKEVAILEVQSKTRSTLDEKIKMKSELKKFTLHEAMRDDKEDLRIVEMRKDNERRLAMNELDNWRIKCNENSKKTITNNNTLNSDKTVYNSKSKVQLNENKTTAIVPLPRQGGTINIKFTERDFPTPKRESSARDEEIWLKKVNDARRASGFISEDLRPEEHDPQWCKDKGDELFKSRNYIGALNAYTHGIKLSDKLPSLYANRAVTQFTLGNFHKCVEDCSIALSLMVPQCELNLQSRVKCIVRRAAALTRIGMLSKAIDEMKFAIKLQPDNSKLKEDLYSMERAWEQDPDSD